MAKRESVYVVKRVPVSGTNPEADAAYEELNLPNPNVYVGQITVELRLFFPPHTPYPEVISAYAEAIREFEQKYLEHEVTQAQLKNKAQNLTKRFEDDR